MTKTPKKRTKKYCPRPVRTNAVDWAIAGVHKLVSDDCNLIINPLKRALEHFKRATAGRQEWNDLAEAMNIAEALAGLSIGPNLLPRIHKTQAALQQIALRLLATGSSACKAPELAAITEVIVCFSAQVQLCTQGELSRALKRVKNMRRSGAMDDLSALYAQINDAVAA